MSLGGMARCALVAPPESAGLCGRSAAWPASGKGSQEEALAWGVGIEGDETSASVAAWIGAPPSISRKTGACV